MPDAPYGTGKVVTFGFFFVFGVAVLILLGVHSSQVSDLKRDAATVKQELAVQTERYNEIKKQYDTIMVELRRIRSGGLPQKTSQGDVKFPASLPSEPEK